MLSKSETSPDLVPSRRGLKYADCIPCKWVKHRLKMGTLDITKLK